MTTNIKKESKEEVLDKKFIENSLKTLGRRFGGYERRKGKRIFKDHQ